MEAPFVGQITVVGNFYFFIFLRLMWEFLDLESERGGSICWPNNKIIDKHLLGEIVVLGGLSI